MAKFNIFLMRLLLATMTLTVAAAAYVEVEKIAPNGDDYAYPPEDTDDLPPEESPEERKFLDGCVKHFTRECGREIFVNMLEEYGPVSEKCCSDLVAAGETCHIAMVKALLALPEFKSKASSGIPKSKQIWNECAWLLSRESPSPSPIPLEI